MSTTQTPSPARASAKATLRQMADKPIIFGSLVTSERTCGNKGCRCSRGQKHISTYLAVNIAGKRVMLCVPKEQMRFIQQCVNNYKRLQEAISYISRDCLDVFSKDKKGTNLF